MAGCGDTGPLDEAVGVDEQRFQTVSQIESYAADGIGTWADGGNPKYHSVAAAFSNTTGIRGGGGLRAHVLAESDGGGADSYMYLIKIDAKPGSQTYAERLSTISVQCGGQPCLGSVNGSASATYTDANQKYAIFGVLSDAVAPDPPLAGIGYRQIQRLRVGNSYSMMTVAGYQGPFGQQGRINGLSVGSRRNGSFSQPTVMFASLQTDHPGNDWRFVADLYDPVSDSLIAEHSVSACTSGVVPCEVDPVANAPGYTAVAYHDASDKFLVVGYHYGSGSVRARWFDSTTGAAGVWISS